MGDVWKKVITFQLSALYLVFLGAWFSIYRIYYSTDGHPNRFGTFSTTNCSEYQTYTTNMYATLGSLGQPAGPLSWQTEFR